jgi:hypothetical protein
MPHTSRGVNPRSTSQSADRAVVFPLDRPSFGYHWELAASIIGVRPVERTAAVKNTRMLLRRPKYEMQVVRVTLCRPSVRPFVNKFTANRVLYASSCFFRRPPQTPGGDLLEASFPEQKQPHSPSIGRHVPKHGCGDRMSEHSETISGGDERVCGDDVERLLCDKASGRNARDMFSFNALWRTLSIGQISFGHRIEPGPTMLAAAVASADAAWLTLLRSCHADGTGQRGRVNICRAADESVVV